MLAFASCVLIHQNAAVATKMSTKTFSDAAQDLKVLLAKLQVHQCPDPCSGKRL